MYDDRVKCSAVFWGSPIRRLEEKYLDKYDAAGRELMRAPEAIHNELSWCLRAAASPAERRRAKEITDVILAESSIKR